ncbi:homeobox protein Dlx1a isoform X3 [Lates japonicus]|uniref:Homeobox protein Dlx1a isoform X3 n=1 Tax=Lates japonicus TaxID=270547 RepID=A0AAD3REJ7_LATJO|nr:homeobox protein Dlx1a isoform X3 [Lates japonicus]
MAEAGKYIMTPDYVTTAIVSDHIEIKDEDLIQRRLRVFFCSVVSLGPDIFKNFPSISLSGEQCGHTTPGSQTPGSAANWGLEYCALGINAALSEMSTVALRCVRL